MPKRRLQCGSCGTVIKVSSRIYRPVCPRCQTAHTFIKCGRAECGTLMCLPENVNQFSCPRCNVQLARPGHTQLKSNPIAVRCGNMTCDFLMTIPGNVGRFRCPRCQMEQVLPGTEEALKCKARHEEEMRLKAIKVRQQEEVRGLCEMFNNMEPSIIDAVYESCEKHRCSALQQLMDMAGDTPALHNALRAEALRLHSVMLHKKRVVESSLRCPISRRLMKDPVLASDGFSYDRASISSWLADKSTSPATGKEMETKTLVPNHQLRSQALSWEEYIQGDANDGDGTDEAGSAHCSSCDSVIPAVSSRPVSAISAVVVEARNVTPHKSMVMDVPRGRAQGADALEAGARQGALTEAPLASAASPSSGGLVASMVRALSDLGTSGGAKGAKGGATT